MIVPLASTIARGSIERATAYSAFDEECEEIRYGKAFTEAFDD
jgi:hypothetical protein